MKIKLIAVFVVALVCSLPAKGVTTTAVQTVPGRWSVEKANAWYAKQPWLVGCNYIPANAINQIEMWQASTFDPKTIDKEMALAKSIGFNTLRVYLHDVVWGADEQGLYKRMDRFLNICKKHGIRPMFVFFDDCHHPQGKLGPQPLPVPEYHNSGWLNSPFRDLATAYSKGEASPKDVASLKGYVQKTMERFADDERVLMWELYNEPGRGANLLQVKGAFGDRTAKLLLDSWRWAREANPSQPICSSAEGCVGKTNVAIAKANSDVISFHSYNSGRIKQLCESYAAAGRPAICTEYMARPGSTFQKDLPVMKKLKIGAINWGFVAGKTGCVWPWGSRKGKDVDQLRADGVVCKSIEEMPTPKTWFHEIFKPDHTPFDVGEVEFIKAITKGE